MFLYPPIGKLNEHMNIPRDRLPAWEGKYHLFFSFFYGVVDFPAEPQSGMDSFGPKLI